MSEPSKLTEFGFSQYEASCYLALLAHHPSNGSQLSRQSGIARSRIYDVLRNLTRKDLAFEVEPGRYVPLPPEELVKRLRRRFETDLPQLEKELNALAKDFNYEYILTIRGVGAVFRKAAEIIDAAHKELYVRLFPRAGKYLNDHLIDAQNRGVGIRYIAMGRVAHTFDIQIEHPSIEKLPRKIGGSSIDIIADKSEALAGVFEKGKEETSPIIWTCNQGFVTANRDSLRHDFYHYFLNKTYDQKQTLTDEEKQIYQFIKADE